MADGKWNATLDAAKYLYNMLEQESEIRLMEEAAKDFERMAARYNRPMSINLNARPFETDTLIEEVLGGTMALPKRCYDGYLKDKVIRLIQDSCIKNTSNEKFEGKNAICINFAKVIKELGVGVEFKFNKYYYSKAGTWLGSDEEVSI